MDELRREGAGMEQDEAECSGLPQLDPMLLSLAAPPDELLATARTFSELLAGEVKMQLAAGMGRLALSDDAELARIYYASYVQAAGIALGRQLDEGAP